VAVSEEQVGRVYAEALFAAADEASAAGRVGSELAGFADALAGSVELQSVLADPQRNVQVKDGVLTSVLDGAHPLVSNTVRLMLLKGRLAVVPMLRREYERLAAEAAGVLDVDVISAVELGAAQEQAIVARVQAATGRTVRVRKRVDEGIVGGLVLRAGDIIVDASVKGRMQQLRRRMRAAGMRGGAR
jgi:F-type H+-transporting ATPase subunit delta